MTKERKFSIYALILAALLIVIDQVTKIYALNNFKPGEYVSVLGDFLQATYVENPGMAFGISFGAGKVILSLFSVLASGGLVWYIFKCEKTKPIVRLALAIVLAGAFGNLIDRVFYGMLFQGQPLFIGNVVDFILVDIPDINFLGLNYTHWPVFNIADACVTIGAIMLILNYKFLPNISAKKDDENEN